MFTFDSACYRNAFLRFHWLIACERRHCCVHVCCGLYLNLVYAQPLQKTVAKLRVSLTLNSSDIAVICASTDVNLINSWLSRDKHRDERTEILCKYSSRRRKLEGERNRHKYVSVHRYSTRSLARLTKPDDSSEVQNIGHVCVFDYTRVNGDETICFSSVATER